MAKRVLKRAIVDFEQDIPIMMDPLGKILSVAFQGSDFRFWTLERPLLTSKQQQKRIFHVFPTGAEVAENYVHRGTAMFMGGAEIWHLFEKVDFNEV